MSAVSPEVNTYLVTGASSGIGRAASLRLLAEGCRVVGVSRRIADSDVVDAFSEYPSRFISIAADLEDTDQVMALPKSIDKRRLVLDGIVFSAGKGVFGALENVSLEEIARQLKINLFSQIALSKAFLPKFKARKAGHLVYIGSEAALIGAKQGTAYCASKFGLRGFTQALRAECAASGVKVSLVNPGMVDTPFFDSLHFMPGDAAENALEPDTVADAIWWVLNTPPTIQLEEINMAPGKKVVIGKPRP